MKGQNLFSVAAIIAFMFCSCKSSFISIEKKNLYDQNAPVIKNQIDGFTAIDIYKDTYDNTVWVSPESNCVEMKAEKQNTFSGSGALHIKWDKIKGGCKWIGCGFGWNNWMAKDIKDIDSIAAIQMKVKSVKGTFKNLPVAFALEDYSGIQCYYGYRMELASGTFNDTAWTSVTIPLSKFELENKNFDLEKVKQFIIQLEGDGNIYLDDIKFIRL